MICGANFSTIGSLNQHQKKRKSSDVLSVPKSKQSRLNQPSAPSTSGEAKKYCKECKIDIPSRFFQNHLKSNQHKSNVIIECGDGIEKINCAFKCRIASYRINNNTTILIDIKQFMESIKTKVLNLLERHKFEVKINIEFFGLYTQEAKKAEEVKSFNTKYRVVNVGDDLEEVYKHFIEELYTKATEFLEKDSGWALKKILYLELNVNRYNPTRGSTYIDLPKQIKDKKAVLNIQNNDDECCKWGSFS